MPFKEKARRVQASRYRRRGAVFPFPTSGRLPLPRARSAERGTFPPYPFQTRRPLCARPAERIIGGADGFAPSPAVRIAGSFAGRDGPGNSYGSAVCRPLSRRFVKSAESFLALFAARRRFDAFFGKPTTYWERFFGRPLYRASVDIVYIIIFT